MLVIRQADRQGSHLYSPIRDAKRKVPSPFGRTSTLKSIRKNIFDGVLVFLHQPVSGRHDLKVRETQLPPPPVGSVNA